MSRPMIIVNAKLVVGSTSKSLTQAALHRIQKQLQSTLHISFRPGWRQCLHLVMLSTDSSIGGERADHDRECLETIFEGDHLYF